LALDRLALGAIVNPLIIMSRIPAVCSTLGTAHRNEYRARSTYRALTEHDNRCSRGARAGHAWKLTKQMPQRSWWLFDRRLIDVGGNGGCGCNLLSDAWATSTGKNNVHIGPTTLAQWTPLPPRPLRNEMAVNGKCSYNLANAVFPGFWLISGRAGLGRASKAASPRGRRGSMAGAIVPWHLATIAQRTNVNRARVE